MPKRTREEIDWDLRDDRRRMALLARDRGDFPSLHAAWDAMVKPVVSWSAFAAYARAPDQVGSKCGPKPILDSDAQLRLVDWILEEPRSRAQVLEEAGRRMFAADPIRWPDASKAAGAKWYRLFRKRHPEFRVKRRPNK